MNDQQRTALGREPADLVVRNGRVCLVEASEFQERDVAIRGGRVAALPEDASDAIGDETTVVDADGRPVIPGLIDAHTHAEVGVPFERVYPHALEGGTTGIVTESNGYGSCFPVAGPEELLAATADIPFDVRVSVPPQSTFDLFEPKRADESTEAALADLLGHDRVVGVGEITWIYVVGRSDPVERLCERARAEGKGVTAHGAGCSGEDLVALSTVADDDHEPVKAEEIIERVENGMHVVGRYGSRDDIGALAGAYERLGPSELSLSTDGIGLDTLVEDGYMNLVLRRTVEAGVDPADAVRMATLNPARHFGMDDRGSLAPGSYADVVVLEDLDSMAVETVLFEGDVVVRDGSATVDPQPHDYPNSFYESAPTGADPAAFHVPASAADADGRVRAIEFVGGMVTRGTTVEPPVDDGNLQPDPDADLLKAGVYDRTEDRWGFTGFLTGYGVGADALATTSTMQLPAALAIGSDEAAMATAVERLAELGGGWVVVDDGSVVAEVPQPIAGVSTEDSIEETVSNQSAVFEALDVVRSDARVGLSSSTFTGVPALKLSLSGYADVLGRELVGLTPDDGER